MVRRAPAVDLIPRELHGRHVVGVACCWLGPEDAGEAALEPSAPGQVRRPKR